MLKRYFDTALPFADFVARAEANANLWRDTYRLARVPAGAAERLAAVPGRWHLLVIVKDWCGDAVNTIPLLARLTEQVPNVDLRVVGRDVHPELMDGYLTNGSRSIPIVILLDEDHLERGWWGPRPRALQEWVMREGLKLDKEERYRHVRTWYARDRGRTTADEIIDVVSCASDPACARAAA